MHSITLLLIASVLGALAIEVIAHLLHSSKKKARDKASGVTPKPTFQTRH
jgi:hypothetical protein